MPSAANSMWKGTAVWKVSADQEEAFSIGPDGFIWSYTIDAAAGKTGRLMSTDLLATTFAIGQAEEARMVLFAADGVNLRFCSESGEPGRRWNPPVLTDFPGSRSAVAIEKVLTQKMGEQLFVGILTRHLSGAGEGVFQFWDSIWIRDQLVFCHTPVPLTQLNAVWLDELAARAPELL